MVALTALTSLAVDLARVQISKTELQRGADAAARAGISGIDISRTEAANRAIATAQLNLADGSAIGLTTSKDIEYWTWDLAKGAGKQVSGSTQANAVRVFARRVASRGNPIKLHFGSLIGFNQCDVEAESIVMRVAAIDVNEDVKAVTNPFLAGMPKGTLASPNNPHNTPDYAGDSKDPKQSPQLVKGLPLIAGEELVFDSIDGDARHDPNMASYNPDGQLNSIGYNTAGSEHGIADMRAPINALVAVFLTDERPDKSAAPSKLDFSTSASRDFATLKPQLKQIFFIGDGKNSAGMQQKFVVPEGATRLFLATWDFYEWNNNAGSRLVTVSRPGKIITVR